MKRVIYLLLGLLVLPSCGGDVDANAIKQVEQLMASNNYESAQSLCDEIIEDKKLKDIPIDDLCRLSMAYIKLSEQINEVENMAKATKCYHEAAMVNADSLASCFAELPVEDIQYVEMLRRLSDAIDAPREIRDSEPVECDDESCQHHEECSNDKSAE